MKKIRSYIGIVISLCFIFLVVKQVDIDTINQVLRRTDLIWLSIALVFYWLEIVLRILRWKRILISVGGSIRYSSIGNTFCISAAANNIFPFRLGDILRAHILGIQINISRFSLMGTIVLEKLMDIVAVLLITCWGAFGVLNQLGATSNMAFVFMIGAVCIVIFGGIFFIVKNKFLSNKLVIFFHERLGHFKKGFSILFNPKNLSLVLLETLLIWSFNTLAIWAIIKSLDVSLTISEMLLLEGLTGLSAAIPSAPAGIGTLQYAFFISFGIVQFDKSVGVAASLLVQAVLLGSITLVGVLIFIFDAKSRQALKRIKHD